MKPDPRERLAEARLMLVLTPAVCPGSPRELLAALGDAIDLVQIRPKPLGPSRAPAPARASAGLAREALDLYRGMTRPPLVIVDDRVDVARALAGEGVAGVHLGRDDTPPSVARELIGPGPLIGLSTRALEEVVLAGEEPIDYVGFGPIHATATKGYREGLGPERAWVASAASAVPLFPIGGIDETNADTLAEVGRAAVGAALLRAPDPARAAERIRAALVAREEGSRDRGDRPHPPPTRGRP